MKIKRIKEILSILFNFPYTIILNFYYLPLKKAIKLPIICYTPITFLKLGGVIQLPEYVTFNMIKLGKTITHVERKNRVRWEIYGKIIFHGKIIISDKTFLYVDRKAVLEFGKNISISYGCRFITRKRIKLGNKIRVSWECTFIDTDFHPLIDIINNTELKPDAPIKINDGSWIGYNSIISKGSLLGKNTTVGSGSVVKGIFKKENSIIGGNPAKLIDEGYIRDDMI